MKEFGVSESNNEKHNNNEQKGQHKTPRFSPIAHADQPSTSVVHEKEWAEPKGEQSAHIDVPKERTPTTEFDRRLLTKTDGLTLFQKENLFKTASQSSYYEVLDELGKVIFTKNDYNYYQYCKDQIVAVLHEECNGEELLGCLQKIPFFKDLYAMSVGVWEGYNLGDHTSMVLGQFRKYQMENWNSSLLTAKEFQLMLAIHDIGKPQAVQETGKTSKQHEYNSRIVPELVRWLGIPEKKSKLMVALTMQDHLGGFLKDVSRSYNVSEKEENAKTVAEKISAEAAKIGVGVEQYFDLITRYYRADAGSYTVDAGGKQSLDYLFEAETAPNQTRAFSEQTQRYYDILDEVVKSIASNTEV